MNAREKHSFQLECFQTGLRDFLLAAKLRRIAGLPDSAQLKDKSGTFQELLKERRRYWATQVVLRRTDNEAYKSMMSLVSQTGEKRVE